MDKIKKQKSYWRSYWPMVIWLDDLNEVVTFLQENTDEVKISTEDYLFKTIEELKAHVGSQTQYKLLITTGTPHVTVDLGANPRLYVPAQPQSTHLFYELEGILSRCQRSFRWAYSFWFMLALTTLATIVDLPLLGYGHSILPEIVPQFLSPVLIIPAFWTIWVCYIRLRRECVIKMQRRSERRSFFERNQDQLMTILFSAMVGGIVTFAGLMVKEHFYPSAPAATAPKSP